MHRFYIVVKFAVTGKYIVNGPVKITFNCIQHSSLKFQSDDACQADRRKLIPVGLILRRAKISCSGSFRRISAAIGSGWTPCRSPDTLCDRIMLEAAIAICSPLALMCSGKFEPCTCRFQRQPEISNKTCCPMIKWQKYMLRYTRKKEIFLSFNSLRRKP